MKKQTRVKRPRKRQTVSLINKKEKEKAFILALMNARLSTAMAFAFVVFAAASIATTTWFLSPELSLGQDYGPVVKTKLASVQQETVVLGEIAYAPVELSSPDNANLKLLATPLEFKEGKWLYQMDWQRTSDQVGSFYINKKNDASLAGKVLIMDSAAQIGRVEVVLEPGVEYQVGFYAQPEANGLLLTKKHFKVLADPTAQTTAATCRNLWVRDSQSGSCVQKQFCDPRTILDQQTFITQQACKADLTASGNAQASSV